MPETCSALRPARVADLAKPWRRDYNSTVAVVSARYVGRAVPGFPGLRLGASGLAGLSKGLGACGESRRKTQGPHTSKAQTQTFAGACGATTQACGATTQARTGIGEHLGRGSKIYVFGLFSTLKTELFR